MIKIRRSCGKFISNSIMQFNTFKLHYNNAVTSRGISSFLKDGIHF